MNQVFARDLLEILIEYQRYLNSKEDTYQVVSGVKDLNTGEEIKSDPITITPKPSLESFFNWLKNQKVLRKDEIYE